MQVSISWLNEFVDLTDKTPEEIAHELTMSGLEVEEIEEIKPKFTNIVTARIEKIDQHPNADKLHLVTINNGTGLKTVVCGAQNIKEGQIIPYASVGSNVLNRKTGEQFTLTPAVIRGVESQGMLCSADELGVDDRNYQDEDGILILNRIFPHVNIGENVEKVLGFNNDTVLHVAPTANRGDEMSVIGIARELCALFDKQLKQNYVKVNENVPHQGFEVEIIDKEPCKYYSIAVLKDIKIKPSPEWMQQRLITSGIRAINNVVDITNYVLLEYGTPLHAFDYDKINGYLSVRYAAPGEKLITLDEVERELTPESVVIATKDKAVCLGGVFGGANSEIDNNSKNLALEAAYFTPASNRRSARSVGYHSEACARFERGVDTTAVKSGLQRAIDLLIEYADAQLECVVSDGCADYEPINITLRFSEIKRILGCEIESDKCLNILERLGFKLLGKNEAAAKFEVPSFRAGDVTREIDLIEEIARINGYDKITPTLPAKSVAPIISLEERIIKKVRTIMSASGFDEVVTTSLIGEPLLNQFGIKFDRENAIFVEKPQSEDYTMLRQTLAANMLNCLKYNWDNGQKVLWFYELGKTYIKTDIADSKNAGVEEKQVLSGVMCGNKENRKWSSNTSKINANIDFYTIKGIVDKILSELKLDKRIKYQMLAESALAESHSTLHPYRTAVLTLLGKQPQIIGYYGELHPELAGKLKINQPAYIFKLDLDALTASVNETVVRYKQLPQFPEVQRDLAVIIPETYPWAELEKLVKKGIANNLFNGCEVFDVYQGEHVNEGFKSVAFRVKLQDASATLTDDIIDQQMANLRSVIKKNISEASFRE